MKIQFFRGIGIPFDGNSDKEGIGGLEIQGITLARELAKREHIVEFYVGESSGVFDGVSYHPLKDFKEDADFVIGVDAPPNASLKNRAVWICWTHTNNLACYAPQVDLIVCNSQWTLEFYQKAHPSGNYRMIPNGFDYDLYATPQRPKRRNSIMFAGHPIKGMDRLPDIFRKVREALPVATLDVYGGSLLWKDGNSAHQAVYDNLVAGGINYCGLVPKEEIVAAFQTTEVYFLPRSSYVETFGLSVVEAMAAGCVPVCSKRGNLANLVTPSSGVLLECDESVDEAEVLVNLLLDKKRRTELSVGAVERARGYDWAKIVPRWEEILQKGK